MVQNNNESNNDENGNIPTDESKNIRKGILDYVFEYPTISAVTAGLSAVLYNWIPKISQGLSDGTLENIISEEWWKPILQFGIQAGIARAVFLPFSKFSSPKFKNFIKVTKLEKKLINEYQELLSNGKLKETLNDLKSCYDKNKNSYYITLSEAQIRNNRYEEGIDNILKNIRGKPNQDIGDNLEPFFRIVNLLTTGISYGKTKFKSKFIHNTEKEKQDLYCTLLSSLYFSKSKTTPKIIISKINNKYSTIEDKLSYANVMNYLHEPNQEYWKPFFELLNEKLSQENKTIQDIVDTSADTRNKVLRYRNVFLKEFSNLENLENELRNLKHFSVISHVVSKALQGKIQDKDYLITPYSGETLLEKINSSERDEIENMLEKAITNLEEIHIHGTQTLDNTKVNAKYYETRIRELFGCFIENSNNCNSDENINNQYDVNYEKFFHEYRLLIAEHLSRAQGFYYKDNNPRNILYEDGIIREIDFEKNLLKSPLIDIVSTTEFSNYHEKEFSEEMVKKYYNDQNNIIENDLDEFLKLYEYARVQRHLELAGYRSRPGNNVDSEIIPFHIMNAYDALINITSFQKENNFQHIIETLEKLNHFGI